MNAKTREYDIIVYKIIEYSMQNYTNLLYSKVIIVFIFKPSFYKIKIRL